MCIMIYKPAGCRLTKKELERCWDNNPDGGGVLHITPTGLFSIKRTMDKDEWVKHCLRHMKKTLWIHARYTTRGENSLKNCHPFKAGDDLFAFMNGTVKDMPDEDERSDTRIFCEDMLPGLPEGWLDNPTLFELVRGYIHKKGQTYGTKFMFINRQGRTWILNEAEGHWHDGMWMSNDWYKKDRAPKVVTSGATYGRYWDDYGGTDGWSKGKVWYGGKYEWPADLPKTHLKYDPKVRAPKEKKTTVKTSKATGNNRKKPKVTETLEVEPTASSTDLILEPDCLYCGVPLRGESVENQEQLTCGACKADQDLVAEELMKTGDMTADDKRYIELSKKSLHILTNDELEFYFDYEWNNVKNAQEA